MDPYWDNVGREIEAQQERLTERAKDPSRPRDLFRCNACGKLCELSDRPDSGGIPELCGSCKGVRLINPPSSWRGKGSFGKGKMMMPGEEAFDEAHKKLENEGSENK